MKGEGRTPGVERGGRVRELFGIHELALRSLRFVIFILTLNYPKVFNLPSPRIALSASSAGGKYSHTN